MVAAAVVVLVLAGLAVAGVRPSGSHGSTASIAAGTFSPRQHSSAGGSGKSARSGSARAGSTTTSAPSAPAAATTTSTTRAGPTTTSLAKTVAAASGLQTSCRTVVHIGDSTSEGLTSPTYLPDPGQRIGAQYRRVGAKHLHFAITGATSVVETLPGTTNSYDAAKDLLAHGVRGCWVIALGTNDSADVAAGSAVGLSARIERMMSLLGDQPVIWVNVRSLVSSGSYAEGNMQRWDEALVQACLQHANMRIYDWAHVVKDNWFISDGIHFTSAGYASRAHLVANALAKAFPSSGVPSAGCLVTTKSLSIRPKGF
jgi:GDSL-like Lipase/Acylhydrolase family